MKKKKFICFLILCFCIVFGFVVCHKDESNVNEKKNIRIVATIFPQYDFVRQLTKGVDGVELSMLASPGVDVHCFNPTPKDIISIENADMFIYVGGKSDVWAEKILNSSKRKNCSVVSLIEVLKKNGKSEKDLEDEHVWTSILNCIKIVEYLEKELIRIDEFNSSKYRENGEEYIKKLLELDKQFKDLASNKKKDFVVFADRFPFKNLFKDYGLKVVSPYSGCSSESEVSSYEMAKIIEKAKKENVSVVLKTETGNKDIAKSIANSCNAKVLSLNSCHSCSKKDFENGKTFLEFYSENLKNLKEALS